MYSEVPVSEMTYTVSSGTLNSTTIPSSEVFYFLLHQCEVYSSLKGDLFEISMFYSGEECLIETLEPVIELPENKIETTIENKIEKYM